MVAHVVKRSADDSKWEVVEEAADGWAAQDRVLELNDGKGPSEGHGYWVRGSNGIVFAPSPKRTEPDPCSWAAVARGMVEDGLMTGDEADRWKDEMKEGGF